MPVQSFAVAALAATASAKRSADPGAWSKNKEGSVN
jgi:hypothetical protein